MRIDAPLRRLGAEQQTTPREELCLAVRQRSSLLEDVEHESQCHRACGERPDAPSLDRGYETVGVDTFRCRGLAYVSLSQWREFAHHHVF